MAPNVRVHSPRYEAYREAWPGVEFVAHEHTLVDLEAKELPGFDKFRSTHIAHRIGRELPDFRDDTAGGRRRPLGVDHDDVGLVDDHDRRTIYRAGVA
jgi:hypothetical protein